MINPKHAYELLQHVKCSYLILDNSSNQVLHSIRILAELATYLLTYISNCVSMRKTLMQNLSFISFHIYSETIKVECSRDGHDVLSDT